MYKLTNRFIDNLNLNLPIRIINFHNLTKFSEKKVK